MLQRPAPFSGGTGRGCRGDLPDGLSEIFLQAGLDSEMTDLMTDLPVGQFSVVICKAGKALCTPVARNEGRIGATGISEIGMFETCRGGLTMSVVRGGPEMAFRGCQDRF
jgi:hypothetical protein